MLTIKENKEKKIEGDKQVAKMSVVITNLKLALSSSGYTELEWWFDVWFEEGSIPWYFTTDDGVGEEDDATNYGKKFFCVKKIMPQTIYNSS